MPRGVGQCNHAAERRAEHDRIRDAERVTERALVIAPMRQIPALLGTILASAVAAASRTPFTDTCMSGSPSICERSAGPGGLS